MKDVEFALAMAKKPLVEDRFFGPLSVAQSVRDAVRRRGGVAREDAVIQRFLDDVAARAVSGDPNPLVRLHEAPEAPAFPSVPMTLLPRDAGHSNLHAAGDHHGSAHPGTEGLAAKFSKIYPWPPPPSGPDGWSDPRSEEEAESPSPTVTVETLRGLRKWLFGPFGPYLPQGWPEVPEIGWGWVPKCCVDKFLYPEVIRPESTPPGAGGARVGWDFSSQAKFKDDGSCWCACCEFRQFVEGVVIQIDMTGVEPPAVFSSGGRLVEDCNIVNPKRPGGYSPAVWAGEPIPGDVAQNCYGERPSNSLAPTSYPHSPSPLEDARDSYQTVCDYTMRDKPGVIVQSGRVYFVHFKVRFVGVIFDTCRYRIKRIRSFFLAMNGLVYAGMPAGAIPGFGVASDNSGESIGTAMPPGRDLG